MNSITYTDGTPVQVGDLVRRSKTAKTVYVVNQVVDHAGEPVVWLGPHTGYTSASVYGSHAIKTLVKVVEP